MATAHMAVRTETLPPLTSVSASTRESMGARVIPIPTPTIKMSPPAPSDPMEITSPAPSSTTNHNSDSDTNGKSNDPPKSSLAGDPSTANSSGSNNANNNSTSLSVNMPAPPPAAAAAVHQPKIVQTAFIHKLYNMLEDPNIQHLISWSASAESFVMSPSADFSKVLSQYFKHTNISSFVRQLNMYGFHKERDVFHTGNPDTTLWEFKHGNGNFKRGDLVGLREIKRRASRHALVHRESNYSKSATSQPGTPAEPIPLPPDSGDTRASNIEHTLYDLSARLQRSEESAHYMHVKNQAVMEALSRLLHFNQELSRAVVSLVPADSSISRDVITLQNEMQRQADIIRTLDEPPEPPYIGRQQYFAGVDNAPVSPRQLAQDDQRRGGANLAVPQARGQNFYRPPVPSNLSVSTRRPYGSISGSGTTQSSPLRTVAAPPPPAPPHPLSNVEPSPASLGRRHTAADIRAHGWQTGPSPFSANAPSTPAGPWPPSPSRVAPEDQRIRDSLSSYSLQTASHAHSHSRPTTPPPPPFANGGNGSSDTFGSWNWSSAGSRENKNLSVKDHSAPPTRRGSMAHILNPSDTAERPDEDEDRREDDRKRQRVL
ncbi:HSF-type DNA-binding-domain-containing protein [Mariannaea sp. PMI_226]|nr:HSF-type DNA-binding-domain-containing protein [Mariannaea sp. PMI_226]